jgi:hypothetical protein
MVGQRIGYVRVSTLDKMRQANSRRYLPAVPSQPQGFPCRVVHGTSANRYLAGVSPIPGPSANAGIA